MDSTSLCLSKGSEHCVPLVVSEVNRWLWVYEETVALAPHLDINCDLWREHNLIQLEVLKVYTELKFIDNFVWDL